MFEFSFWHLPVFFRIEDVPHIRYGDITFHDTYVAIKVDRCKTDQLRKGNEVVIARSLSQDVSPVLIFMRYVSELERFPVSLVIMFLSC